MAALNKLDLIGNLTRDPELRYTPGGMAVVSCGIAVNRKWRNAAGEAQEETTFVDLTAFARTAEAMSEFCKKGASVYIGGRLHLDEWEDKTTGEKRRKLVVVAENVQFLDRREGK